MSGFDPKLLFEAKRLRCPKVDIAQPSGTCLFTYDEEVLAVWQV